jgi:restriction system protein
LKKKPGSIDLKFLMQFPEFQKFRHHRVVQGEELVVEEETGQTPEEILEASYQSFRIRLAQEILAQVKECSPSFFEKLVVDLLVAMGYGGSRKDAGQAIGQSGDEGIDGIIKEDKLGLDVVYVQAKKWGTAVGRPLVQAFAGSLDGQRARKGVMITTSHFSQDAKDYVNRIEKKIVLIDGEQLAQFMIDHEVGVTEVARYVVKRIDLDYIDEE